MSHNRNEFKIGEDDEYILSKQEYESDEGSRTRVSIFDDDGLVAGLDYEGKTFSDSKDVESYVRNPRNPEGFQEISKKDFKKIKNSLSEEPSKSESYENLLDSNLDSLEV